MLRGLNAAYNARRQRVLDGKTPDQVVAERLKLATARPHGRAGPADNAKARLNAEAAKDVSSPDIGLAGGTMLTPRPQLCMGKSPVVSLPAASWAATPETRRRFHLLRGRERPIP